MKNMKKLIALLLGMMLILSGCVPGGGGGGDDPIRPDPVDPIGPVNPDGEKDAGIGNETSDTNFDISINNDITISEETAAEDITNLDLKGISYDEEKKLFTITAPAQSVENGSGEYVFTGNFEGNILIDAGDNDEVKITLNNFTIKSDTDSPIKCTKGSELQISAKKGSNNYIYDKRSVKVVDDDNQGNGAITSDCDLKISGKGSLTIVADYNNGIHTKDDLKFTTDPKDGGMINVKSVNNCLKGNDSVEIESGNLALISTSGNGIVTENTDVSSKGKQRGTITISGGHLDIYSAKDAIDASYNVEINSANTDEPIVNIYTNKFSTYTGKVESDSSTKGIKADNEIKISSGQLFVKSNDDAIHANYGDAFENGSTGQGIITISGGTFNLYSADDAIHADNTLNIQGGDVNVKKSVEGIEANFILFNGGYTKVYSVDDGVNASMKINKIPSITINGGTLDVTVYGNDVDGIDSNGTFTQNGGIVITKGANNRMATGLDCDRTAAVNGGTFIAFGSIESRITKGTGISNYTLSGSYGAGNYTIAFPNAKTVDISTKYSYSQVIVYSDNSSRITITKK